MNNRIPIVVFLLAVFCLTPLLPGALAQSAASAPADAVKGIPQLYRSKDAELSRELKELAEKYPSDLEVNAWYVWDVAGSNNPLREPPQEIIAAMKKISPDNPWTMLASAATGNGDQVKALVDKAVAKAQDNLGILLLATEIMKTLAVREGDAEVLRAFVSAHKLEYERSADGLMAEGGALRYISLLGGGNNSDAVAELANRALKLDAHNAQAILAVSDSLAKQQKPKENYELLKGAVQGRADFSLHYAYWKAVKSLPGSTPDQQEKELAADLTEFISRKQPTAYTVRLIFARLKDFPPELLTVGSDLILKKYPNSTASDAVLFQRGMQDLPLSTAEQNTLAKINALETFVDRPKHYDDEILKLANTVLASLYAKQEKPDPERFYKAIAVGEHYTSHVIALVNQKAHLPELERMALKELDGRWGQLKLYSDKVPEKRLKNVVNSVSRSAAGWEDVVGWIYFQQGKMTEAQDRLELAVKLTPNDAETTIHLGRVYEIKGELDKAEQLYSDSMGKNYESEREHPAIALLRQLYVRKHGSTVGLEAYMKPIIERGREIRKSNILARRVASPKPMPSFSLNTLQGDTVTSESLKGKILVINFWATWCGPCRAEMPEIQKFYVKYKNDPNVVFLSMSIDEPDTPNENVRDYLTKNKYTFPVLRAYSYGTSNGINGIPETWFVDANGNRAFEGIAGSKELVEEFSWRIEAVKTGNKGTATK